MASHGTRDVEIETHLCRTVSSETWYFAKSEQAFIVSEEYTNASTGDTVSLTLSNPSGSGTTAVFSPMNISALAQSYIRVYDEFSTAPSGGNSSDVQNVLLDSSGGAPDTGDVTADRNQSFAESATHASRVIGGGAGEGSIGASSDLPVLALEPDRTIVIEVEKLASGSDPVTITARWFEVPQVYSETTTDPPISDAVRP